MKTKSIILSGLLLLGIGAATTSCEDMMEPDNTLVSTDLAPKDTVYQVMGIVKKMQKLVDRSVLLGEVRADLVNVNESASLMLKQLAANETDEANVYNNPSDYYDVINSCNIYLAYVDSSLVTHGEKYYLKEIVAVKSYRAWAYLELAKIYGEVPFVTEPIITADAAEQAVLSGERRDMVGICDYFIQDLRPYAELAKNNELRPSYSASFNEVSLDRCFIPVRVMLGELLLWRGSFTQSTADFEDAARYYHDFLTFTNEERSLGNSVAYWGTSDFTGSPQATQYQNLFAFGKNNTEILTAIPMDTVEYFGTYSDLSSLFNSQHKNNYYAPISPSKRIREISQAQTYCRLQIGTVRNDTLYAPKDKNHFLNEDVYIGDLRLSSVLTEQSYNDKYHGEYSKERQTIVKYSPNTNGSINTGGQPDRRLEAVTLFRLGTVYLHMAEALNRAGYPETAFAVLKYGLTEDVLADSTIVSTNEYNRLKLLTSRGFSGNFTEWEPDMFWSIVERNFTIYDMTSNTQYGMHSRGSGDSQANASYYLPADSANVELMAYDEALALALADSAATAEDTLAYYANRLEVDEHNYNALQPSRIEKVDSLILEELALEGMFEGHRYYDLMRYSKFNGKPNFLAERVAERGGKEAVDQTVMNKLSNEQWYLPLRKR